MSDLKNVIKQQLTTLSEGMNYTKLEKALDPYLTGQISKSDYLLLIDDAVKSRADTSGYHKIVESLVAANKAKI